MNTSQEELSPPLANKSAQQHQSQYGEEHDSLKNKLPHPENLSFPTSNPNKIIPLQETSVNQSSKSQLYVPNPIEIIWKNLVVDVQVEKKIVVDHKTGRRQTVKSRRRILDNLNGCIQPGEFTAILGPSGCGKTTLLNFLSGRILGTNIEVSGKFILNGQEISDIDEYSNQIAYVMQDDILMACFTPTDLRLRNLSESQKVDRVNNLIKELGLTRCKNTKVGNSLIRGISGGERKRTSIGVELLTNPSMLFLDEPTTGLDSSTALQVMALLKMLSRRGVNVVSTIHQPSSEIFTTFERLILICKGSIIYQGLSKDSVEYFGKLGFIIPPFSNPSDYFMKLMNAEGLQVELTQKGQKQVSDSEINRLFDERLDGFIKSYKESSMGLEPSASVQFVLSKNDNSFNVSQMKQFYLLFKRSILAQIRDPMDSIMKTVQLLIFAVLCIVSFQPLGEGQQGYQNRVGLIEFVESTLAYGAVQGAITTFSSERQIFVRERLSKSYGVGPYFWSKSLAELPFQLFYPIALVCIIYHAMGLNNKEINYFLICHIIMFGTYFSGTSMGLCMSVLIPKVDIAITLLPAVITPVQVLGGFFINTNNVPKFLKWIEYISIFKYSFQAAALNEFDTLNYDSKDFDPIATLGIKESMWSSIGILFAIGVGFRVLCYIFLFLISSPSKPKLNQKLFKGI